MSHSTSTGCLPANEAGAFLSLFTCFRDQVTVFAKHFKPVFLHGVRYTEDTHHGNSKGTWLYLPLTFSTHTGDWRKSFWSNFYQGKLLHLTQSICVFTKYEYSYHVTNQPLYYWHKLRCVDLATTFWLCNEKIWQQEACAVTCSVCCKRQFTAVVNDVYLSVWHCTEQLFTCLFCSCLSCSVQHLPSCTAACTIVQVQTINSCTIW